MTIDEIIKEGQQVLTMESAWPHDGPVVPVAECMADYCGTHLPTILDTLERYQSDNNDFKEALKERDEIINVLQVSLNYLEDTLCLPGGNLIALQGHPFTDNTVTTKVIEPIRVKELLVKLERYRAGLHAVALAGNIESQKMAQIALGGSDED